MRLWNWGGDKRETEGKAESGNGDEVERRQEVWGPFGHAGTAPPNGSSPTFHCLAHFAKCALSTEHWPLATENCLTLGTAIAHERLEDALLGLRKNLPNKREQACCAVEAQHCSDASKNRRPQTVTNPDTAKSAPRHCRKTAIDSPVEPVGQARTGAGTKLFQSFRFIHPNPSFLCLIE